MAQGTIVRIIDETFGFIRNEAGKELFFHSSAYEGDAFNELSEGQRVSYNSGDGPNGARAENVRRI